MTSWPEWIESGDRYIAASGASDKPSRFAGSLRYNLIALAFESYAMAMLDFIKILPENHTISDLITALQRYIVLDSGLAERILSYERFQRICSFIDYERTEAGPKELDAFAEAVRELGVMAHIQCVL